MDTDHDYGDKFIDFAVTAGGCRLGLLPRKGLAKDAGVDEPGRGFSAIMLSHTAESRAEMDQILAAVETAGGRVTSRRQPPGTVTTPATSPTPTATTGRSPTPPPETLRNSTR